MTRAKRLVLIALTQEAGRSVLCVAALAPVVLLLKYVMAAPFWLSAAAGIAVGTITLFALPSRADAQARLDSMPS